ncbi:MAG: diacylglycerol kinase family lipid kinase [Bryobacteraceae bacterium]|nr:diacylglycerol kinase family lipid kinase [Bryobacteraceae bacterium]
MYNPQAGTLRRHNKLVEAVLRRLQEAGHRVFLRPTRHPGDATQLARQCVEEGADVILVAGGDGTINEVANGMIHSDTPLGILPAGTANVLAMELRMGASALRAAEKLGEWEPVRIGVGLVCEPSGAARRHFLLMAGAGLDAHIVAHLNLSWKRILGKGAYWAAGFASLGRRLEELEARNGTRSIRCSFALASRVRNYGGDLEIALGASLLEDHFEVVLFEGSNPFRYLKYFAGVLTGTTARLGGVTLLNSTHLELRPAGEAPVYLQVDGENSGFLPVELRFVPQALTLLAPPKYLASERARWTT